MYSWYIHCYWMPLLEQYRVDYRLKEGDLKLKLTTMEQV